MNADRREAMSDEDVIVRPHGLSPAASTSAVPDGIAAATPLPPPQLPTTFDFYFQTLIETSTETLTRGLNVLVAEFGKTVLIPRLYAEQPSLANELPMASAINCADRWLTARKAGEAMPAPVAAPPSASALAAEAKRKADEAPKGPPAKKTYYSTYELGLMQVPQLKMLCKLNGAKVGGRKPRLIDNLSKCGKPIETIPEIDVSAKKAKRPERPPLVLPTAEQMRAGGFFGGFGGGGGGMFGGALLSAMMGGGRGGPAANHARAAPAHPMTITQVDEDEGDDDDPIF
jgi:hypothetical protein